MPPLRSADRSSYYFYWLCHISPFQRFFLIFFIFRYYSCANSDVKDPKQPNCSQYQLFHGAILYVLMYNSNYFLKRIAIF
jgi:hypothetical protein